MTKKQPTAQMEGNKIQTSFSEKRFLLTENHISPRCPINQLQENEDTEKDRYENCTFPRSVFCV